ncbi:uncharacterized protein [Drosophila bipectinata]|uniref:uncharacterized protein n=1 Tax=Drosophila bipectinata TaxID=42026 RepID=UPI0038B40DBF
MFPKKECQYLKGAGDCKEAGTLMANEEILLENGEVRDIRELSPTSSSSIKSPASDVSEREDLDPKKSFDRLKQKLRLMFAIQPKRKPPPKETVTPPAQQPAPSPPDPKPKASKTTVRLTSSQESITSQEMAKLKDQIDQITEGINSLESWIPILDDQERLRMDENSQPVREVFTSVNNTPKERISDGNMQGDDLPLPIENLEVRNHSRDHYCGMQEHLVNMLLVPKSETSLHLNPMKNLRTSLRLSLGQRRPEFTPENRSKDYAAAEYLKRSRNAAKQSKNVRRQ